VKPLFEQVARGERHKRQGDHNGGVSGAIPAIETARAADAGEILTLQRAAYQSEALLYGDPALPPLVQTLDDLKLEMEGSLFLKAVIGGRIVGSVRARADGATCHVGRLIVAPDMQGRGIGTRLMEHLEGCMAGRVERFEVFTGSRSSANLRFYRTLGYRELRRAALTDAVELVYLEKPLLHR
jgi:GNAT superfamily N-acetyltransferase